MERVSLQRVADLFRASRRVLVVGHVRPDGDAAGSMVALGLGLRGMGIAADVWASTPVPPRYRFLAPVIEAPSAAPYGLYDLCAILDTPTRERVDVDPALLAHCPVVLMIDHHPPAVAFTTHQWIDQTQGAVACMIHELLECLGAAITRPIADALYTGIMTDTGCFMYPNADRRVFALAMRLVDAGADTSGIARAVYSTMTTQQVRLLGDMLSTLELMADGTAALMHIDRDMFLRAGACESDTEDFVNYVRAIDTAVVAALLTEVDGGARIRINMRSKTSAVDVRALAAAFGGGGHACAAGATADGPLCAFLPVFRIRLEAFAKGLSWNQS